MNPSSPLFTWSTVLLALFLGAFNIAFGIWALIHDVDPLFVPIWVHFLGGGACVVVGWCKLKDHKSSP